MKMKLGDNVLINGYLDEHVVGLDTTLDEELWEHSRTLWSLSSRLWLDGMLIEAISILADSLYNAVRYDLP